VNQSTRIYPGRPAARDRPRASSADAPLRTARPRPDDGAAGAHHRISVGVRAFTVIVALIIGSSVAYAVDSTSQAAKASRRQAALSAQVAAWQQTAQAAARREQVIIHANQALSRRISTLAGTG
jgi:hypothetical protein